MSNIAYGWGTSPESSNETNGLNSEDDSSLKHSGGNGGGNDMLDRVKKLEDDMQAIKTDLAVMKSNYATKEDIASVRVELHQSISTQTKWLAATMIGIAALAMAIAKLIF